MEPIDWKQVLERVIAWAMSDGVRLVVAAALLWVTFRLINLLGRRIVRRGKRLDKTLTVTLVYFGKILFKTLITLALLGYVGLDTGALAALLASLGVGVGLAVNGALSNLAGGVLILLTRPFRIDDYIEVGEFEGTVEDIHIVATKLRTPDNRVVYLPNGSISAGSVVNHSEKPRRRVDIPFPVPYDIDPARAEAAILSALAADSRVRDAPAPTVRISAYRDSALELIVKAWVRREDYWDVYFDLLENIPAALTRAGIAMPFPQRELRMKK